MGATPAAKGRTLASKTQLKQRSSFWCNWLFVSIHISEANNRFQLDAWLVQWCGPYSSQPDAMRTRVMKVWRPSFGYHLSKIKESCGGLSSWDRQDVTCSAHCSYQIGYGCSNMGCRSFDVGRNFANKTQLRQRSLFRCSCLVVMMHISRPIGEPRMVEILFPGVRQSR